MDNNSEYNLYTEKITNKGKLKKKASRLLTFIFGTIILSAVAAVVFFEVNKYLTDISSPRNKDNPKVSISIPVVETSSKSETTGNNIDDPDDPNNPNNTNPTIPYNIDNPDSLDYLSAVAKDSYASIATVTAYISSSALFGTMYEKTCSGLVIIKNDKTFYILCENSTLSDADSIVVRFYNGINKQAVFMGGDETTNLAVVSVTLTDDELSRNYANDFNSIKEFSIANSDIVLKDDSVIAVGNICNGEYTYNVGRITNISNYEYAIDSMYGIFNTSISCGLNYGGALINRKGELIGVITSGYESKYGNSLVSAYSLNTIKNVINCLSNGGKIKTIGIEGREVTVGLSESYSMPRGIYVKSVNYNSPAFKANIQVGDIIKSINSQTVYSFDRFQELILGANAEENLTLVVSKRSDNGYKDVTVTLNFGN